MFAMIASKKILSLRYHCSGFFKKSLPLVGRTFSSKSDINNILEAKFEEFQTKNTYTFCHKLPPHADYVIIGGGAIGLSIAFWLKHVSRNGYRVVVIEKDPTYSKASGLLARSGLKQQYGLEDLIKMSKFSAEFFRDIKQYLSVPGIPPPDIAYNHQGFLTLTNEKNMDILEDNYAMQRSVNVDVEMLNKSQLQERYPWMNVSDIEAGCYGLQEEGWFDPGLLLAAYKVKCVHLGVEFYHGEVSGFTFKEIERNVVDTKRSVNKIQVKSPTGEIKEIKCSLCINCAGPWARDVANMVGIGSAKDGCLSMGIPIEPRKKFLYLIHCPHGPGLEIPVVLDTSGIFIRREGLRKHYLCGTNITQDTMNIGNQDAQEFFESYVRPALVNRIPAFENLEVLETLQGVYDHNYFDGAPIIGNHPSRENFLMAAGFNGEGPQLSPAIGRAFMERIVKAEYKTIDLEKMLIDRFYADEKVIDTSMMLSTQ